MMPFAAARSAERREEKRGRERHARACTWIDVPVSIDSLLQLVAERAKAYVRASAP